MQYLRWHCRIKVGHTKSLAVFADDLLMRRPFLELEQAASFAGLKPDRRSLVEVLEAEELTSGLASSKRQHSRGIRPSSSLLSFSYDSSTVVDPWQHHVPSASTSSTTLHSYQPFSAPQHFSSSPRRRHHQQSQPSQQQQEQQEHQQRLSVLSRRWSSQQSPFPPSLPISIAEQLVTAFEDELRRSNTLQKWPCGSISNDATPLGTALAPNCSAGFGVRCFAGGDTIPGEFI